MTEIIITDQDRQMLDFVAKGEATSGGDPYISLYPSDREPLLTQMTLAEVDRFQTQRRNARFKSSACGRYQFIRKTLRYAVGLLGIDPARTRFTPDVQDALILRILRTRGYYDWKGGTLPTDRFMIKLAQEFASMPVPYPMQGHFRPLRKGETYYANYKKDKDGEYLDPLEEDNLNRAKVDPGPTIDLLTGEPKYENPADDIERVAVREAGTDTIFQELEDIRTGEPGVVRTIPVNSDGPSGVLPSTGTTPRSQTANRAAGQGVGAYVGGNAGSRPLVSTVLPAATGAVYQYRTIDPLDDRYDFRTGEKIKDLSIHGTAAAAQTPVVNGNIGPARVATTNSGVEPPVAAPEITDAQLSQVAELQSNISDALGNLLTDSGSVASRIADRASSLFNATGLNSALTGGRTTDTNSFDSAVATGSSQNTNQSTTTPNRSNPPRPISGSNRGPQQ